MQTDETLRVLREQESIRQVGLAFNHVLRVKNRLSILQTSLGYASIFVYLDRMRFRSGCYSVRPVSVRPRGNDGLMRHSFPESRKSWTGGQAHRAVSVGARSSRKQSSLKARRWAMGLLRHLRRRRLLEFIAANPGHSLRQVLAATELPQAPGRHHLKVLERAGLVSSVAQGRAHRFFLAGSTLTPALVLLSDPGLHRLFDLVRSAPGLSQGQIRALASQASPIKRSTLQHRLGRLQAAGVIQGHAVGREIHYFAFRPSVPGGCSQPVTAA